MINRESEATTIRHTRRCDEARSCGHPNAFCVCSAAERLHETWKEAKSGMLVWVPHSFELRRMHDAAAALARHEREYTNVDEDVCPICRDEDGP